MKINIIVVEPWEIAELLENREISFNVDHMENDAYFLETDHVINLPKGKFSKFLMSPRHERDDVMEVKPNTAVYLEPVSEWPLQGEIDKSEAKFGFMIGTIAKLA